VVPEVISFVSYKPGDGIVSKGLRQVRLALLRSTNVIVKAVPEVAARISELKAGSADLMWRAVVS